MASTALPPRVSASATIRPTTSSRLIWRFFVIPLNSPPARDLKAAPSCDPTLRERTVRPKPSPSTEVTLYPGTSFMVEINIAAPFDGGADHRRRLPNASLGSCPSPKLYRFPLAEEKGD